MGASTSTSVVQVTWTTLSSPQNGDSTITSYNIYWDQGTSTWTSLAGESSPYTGTTYTISLGITSGSTYQFKVRAKNKWGFGDFSTTTSVVASSVPSQMSAPTTAIDGATGGVEISWTAPASNGQTITSYLIEIQDSSSGW